MKKTTSFLAIGLLAAGLLTHNFLGHSAKADSPRQAAATVILGYEIFWDAQGHDTGMVVHRVSRSANAPVIEVGWDLAEAMAILQDAGFELAQPTLRTEFVFNRRPR